MKWVVMKLKIHCQYTAKQPQSDAYNFVQGLCPINKKLEALGKHK
jgi:hypothetical protein